MLKYLIQDLEQMLNETNKLKSDLKNVCEREWELLHPAGSAGRGTFCKCTTQSLRLNEQDCEVSNRSSMEGSDILNNISDLIAYSKEVRSTINRGNKGSCNNSKDPCNLITTKKSNVIGARGNVTKPRNLSKQLQQNKTTQLVKSSKVHIIPSKSNEDKDVGAVSRKSSEIYKEDKEESKPDIYSHSCSLTLSSILNTFKMNKELYNLLRHYHDYQKNKFRKSNLNENGFERRFVKLTKLKLENHIKANNMKNRDKFIKYLHVAENINSAAKNIKSSDLAPIQYGSVEQLALYQSKLQMLMELNMQRRILDKLNAVLS